MDYDKIPDGESNPEEQGFTRSDQETIPRYAWVILVTSFLIASVAYAAGYSFGVFFKPLQREFGWPAADISIVFSIYMFSYCLFGIAAGWAVDRLGARITSVCGGILVGSGFLCSSAVDKTWEMCLAYGLLVGPGTSAFYSPLVTTASRWFPFRQGLALGVVTSGVGVGTFLGPVLFGYLISTYGWRFSYSTGGSAIGCMIVILGLLIKRHPNRAITNIEGSRASVSAEQELASHSQEHTLPNLLHLKDFWLFSSIYLLVGFGLQIMIAHVVPYTQQSYGFSPVAAGAVLSVIGMFSVIGRLAMGVSSDYIGNKTSLLISLSIEAVAIFATVLLKHPSMLYVFGALLGFGYGGHAPQLPALTRQLFGIRQMGRNLGVQQLFYGIGAFIGPFFAGWLLDSSGGYRIAFVAAASSLALAALLSTKLRFPKSQHT